MGSRVRWSSECQPPPLPLSPCRLEQELGDKEYLMGEFSLVDADLIPRFTRLEGFGVLPDPALPRLGKYLQRMKDRPSVKTIL